MASNRESQMPPLPGAEQSAPDASQAPAQPAKKKMVDVIAMRAGFYRQKRISVGMEFQVREDELGTWMKCVDPVLQKKHEVNMRAKKEAIKKAVI